MHQPIFLTQALLFHSKLKKSNLTPAIGKTRRLKGFPLMFSVKFIEPPTETFQMTSERVIKSFDLIYILISFNDIHGYKIFRSLSVLRVLI